MVSDTPYHSFAALLPRVQATLSAFWSRPGGEVCTPLPAGPRHNGVSFQAHAGEKALAAVGELLVVRLRGELSREPMFSSATARKAATTAENSCFRKTFRR